jgi:hypothetical protein
VAGLLQVMPIDVPPVMKPQSARESLSRIAGEGAARAEVLHGLPWGGPNGGVVSVSVRERGETGVVGGRKDEGLLEEDGEDGGVRGSDGGRWWHREWHCGGGCEKIDWKSSQGSEMACRRR